MTELIEKLENEGYLACLSEKEGDFVIREQ